MGGSHPFMEPREEGAKSWALLWRFQPRRQLARDVRRTGPPAGTIAAERKTKH